MLIGHVRWIGLLANVWCSNLSEFSEKKYATRSFTLMARTARGVKNGLKKENIIINYNRPK